MEADRIRAQLQGGGMMARIVVERGGEVAATLDVDPATLEEAVESLARVRALMPEPIREEVGEASRLAAPHDCRWEVHENKMGPLRILSFGHPGFGWVSFAMSDGNAAALAEALVKPLPHELPGGG